MAIEIDIVSDLNDGSADTTIPAMDGDASHGRDAVSVNNQTPAREPTPQPKVVGEKPDAADKPVSIRDTISAALKPQADTPDAAKLDGGDRPRNPDGTFATLPVEPVLDPNTPALVTAPVVAAPTGIDPAVFASLPAETQASLARTMEGVAQSQQRFARLEPIEQLLSPRFDAWALNGMQPSQALGQLLALSDFAGRDMPGFIKYMAAQGNVDLEELVLGMDDTEPTDPKIAALEREIAELKGVTSGFTQQQQQAAHNALVDNVLAFADEKGPDGNVLRPYLSELGETWLPYISMVKDQNPNWTHAQVLQQAYDNACWNNTGVRSKMQATADAAATADRLRKETERVASAQSASVSLPSGTPTTPPVAPADAGSSVRDAIRAAVALHS